MRPVRPARPRTHRPRSTPIRPAPGRSRLTPGTFDDRTATPRSILPGLALVGVLAVGATVVVGFGPSVLSPLVVGVIAGAVVANCIELPSRFEPGIAFCARTILRAGLVLLGLRLSLGDLGALGLRGLGVVAGVVTVTFLGTQWLARRMGVDDRLGLLIATGYSICGASAIAAMDGVVDADEEETAYAIALVTLCGSLSIIVLPSIASAVDLTGAAFGTWVGAAVHDVGQVVATAGTGGSEALAAATVVKLTRVVLLAPLVAIVALRRRPVRVGPSDETERPPLVPLFVVGFLVAVLVRSAGLLGPNALTLAADLEKVALTVALVALGLGVRIDRLRRLSGRPLALGMAAWVLVAGAAFVGTSIAV